MAVSFAAAWRFLPTRSRLWLRFRLSSDPESDARSIGGDLFNRCRPVIGRHQRDDLLRRKCHSAHHSFNARAGGRHDRQRIESGLQAIFAKVCVIRQFDVLGARALRRRCPARCRADQTLIARPIGSGKEWSDDRSDNGLKEDQQRRFAVRQRRNLMLMTS